MESQVEMVADLKKLSSLEVHLPSRSCDKLECPLQISVISVDVSWLSGLSTYRQYAQQEEGDVSPLAQ